MKQGLAFDDVLLVPQHSSVLPKEVEISTFLTENISLAIPIVSAAMDTVTESEMAITLAKEGGIGIIHKNMSIEKQAEEVDRVKRYESGIVQSPITLHPEERVKNAIKLMERYNISGFPIVDKNGKLVGILTKRDVIFQQDIEKRVDEIMTKKELVIADVGVSLEEAEDILKKKKVEKLPVVDKKGVLKGLITIKDISKRRAFPKATKDDMERLRVGAAIGITSDIMDRARELCRYGCDVLVIDTAHAHSEAVLSIIPKIKAEFGDTALICGNIATEEAFNALTKLGIDGVKVGIGPGSICTTRIIAGVGVPQLTAIMDCAKVKSCPMIADGGIRFSGDITKALATGADSVMIGSILAGTEESPGETILLEGRRYKSYRAMGSIGAMKQGSSDRYFQEDAKKLVPEGVEGMVPHRGNVSEIIYQLVGGLKSGMGYCGARNLKELREKAKFIGQTKASLMESHPHDITITKEPPNYEI